MQPTSIFDSITNTKTATVLMTLGLPLAKPGVFITYDKESPKSSGGTAHFLFDTNIKNAAKRHVATYDEGKSIDELETFLDGLRQRSDVPKGLIEEIEAKLTDALIVYGRKFLDNYQVVVKSLKEDIKKWVVVGGTPIFDSNGNIAGIQDFSMKGLKLK